MDFLKRHFEKMFLGVILVGLVISVFLILGSVNSTKNSLGEGLDAAETAVRGGQRLELATADSLGNVSSLLSSPKLSLDILGGDKARGALFAPGSFSRCMNPECMRVIPFDDDLCPFCGTEQPPIRGNEQDLDGDGILDFFERTTTFLSPTRRDDGDWDYDRDTFTNAEEYKEGTKLDDFSSFPPLAANLRYTDIFRRPLPITLKSISTNESQDPAGWDISLAYVDPTRRRPRTKPVRIGDELLGYTVTGAGFETRAVKPAEGEEEDPAAATAPAQEEVPFVMVKDADANEYKVVQGEETLGKKLYVRFIFLANRERRNARILFARYRFEAELDQEFKLTHRTSRTIQKFKVTELRDDKVVVQLLDAGTPGITPATAGGGMMMGEGGEGGMMEPGMMMNPGMMRGSGRPGTGMTPGGRYGNPGMTRGRTGSTTETETPEESTEPQPIKPTRTIFEIAKFNIDTDLFMPSNTLMGSGMDEGGMMMNPGMMEGGSMMPRGYGGSRRY